MRNAIRSLTILAAIGTALHAAPFLAMGDSAELFLTGTLGVRTDSNVLLSAQKSNDTIFNLTPGLDLVYGQNALTKGKAYFQESIDRFIENNRLNTSLASLGFNANYDDQKTKIIFDTSFVQLAQNTVDTRPTAPPTGTKSDFIRRDIFHVEGGSEISVSDKTSVGGSVVYEDTDYKRTGYASSKITSIPLDYYYYVLPKLALSGGFTYRNTSLSGGGISSKDYFYNVGARGEFTPKLTGKLAIGYTERQMDSGPNQNTLGVASSFAFAIDEKTALQFGVTNDFGVSGVGQNERNLTWTLGAQTALAADWSVGANLSYRSINYLGAGAHTDNYFEGSITATYTYSTQINFTATATYRNNSSTYVSSTFDDSVFSVAANFRF